jgi:hypothetical protein
MATGTPSCVAEIVPASTSMIITISNGPPMV